LLPEPVPGIIPAMTLSHVRLATSLVVAALGALGASIGGCSCDPVPIPPAALCGSGTVDGTAYALDAEKSRFVIAVKRPNGNGACGVFHSHVVDATQVEASFTVAAANAASSSLIVRVAAAGLVPDDPDLRAELLPEGENFPLSDGDRRSITGSVAEEVNPAGEFPILTFSVSGISATSGDGTATLTSDIAGATSDVDTSYTISKEGDAHIIKGTATLIGTPHGIPRNALGFCIDPNMLVTYELHLVPGAVTCDPLGGGEPFVEEFFADEACAEDVGFNEVAAVATRRCAGCHAEVPKLGATVPLVVWEDWRVDSIRNPGRPLYESAFEFVHLDPADGLSMPPQPPDGEILTTDLSDEELALFDAWVDGGARNAACENDPGPFSVGPAIPVNTECSDEYTAGNPGETAADFFNNSCAYCHLDNSPEQFYAGIPQIAQLDEGGTPITDEVTTYAAIDFTKAAAAIDHPFYVNDDGERVSFWVASLARIADQSMVPGGLGDVSGDPAFLAFEAWVNNGHPAPCAD
jgi:hypothetical protein